MRLLRLMIVALSVLGWQMPRAHAWEERGKSWAVSMVLKYIDVEREVDRFLATPEAERRSDQVFTALRLFASGWSRSRRGIPTRVGAGYLFAHMKHFQWMMTPPYDRSEKGAPTSSAQVIATAKQWACAQFVDTLLWTYSNSNDRRWRAPNSGGLDDENDGYEALLLDFKDEIARFHEATQVEIVLFYGENDQVVGPKYMELFEMCLSHHLKDLSADHY